MPHRLYNGMRGRYPLAEIVRLWEAGDRLLGFACCYPAWQGYDAQVHHDFRGSDLEREILTWAYQETYGWLEQAGYVECRCDNAAEFMNINTPEALAEARTLLQGD